jgi:predicted nucleotidyltransferase
MMQGKKNLYIVVAAPKLKIGNYRNITKRRKIMFAPKTIEEVKSILIKHKKKLRKKYKVKEIGTFGSYVRNEQKKTSDIDILVEFENGGETFDNYMELKFFLEDILNIKVDLVIKNTLRKEIERDILSEVIYV